MRNTAFALLFVTAALAQDQPGDEALGKAKEHTVMINATMDGDTRPGAGIIFGLANNQIYIATANHLVRHGLATANGILVEFHWLPGEPVSAQLLTYYDDRALDLAVVVVDSSKAHLPQTGLSEESWGNPRTLTRDSAVSAIGYPNGTAFDVSAGRISQMEAVSLKYRVAGLVPGGYSGGPLLDRNGMIVGMIRQDQPPDGEATRIDLVIDQLKAWNYPVGKTDAFRDVLLRFVAEASSGFRGVGAPQSGSGSWNPTITFPGLVQENVTDRPLSCRGSMPPSIKCVLFISYERDAALQKFESVTREVGASLPTGEWKSDISASPVDGPSSVEWAKRSVRVRASLVNLNPNNDVVIEIYDVRSGPPGNPSAGGEQVSKGDPFRDALLRYLAEAPSGFRALGAKQFGNWTPSISLPDAVSCRGAGTSKEPSIECVLYRTSSEAEAADKFEDLIDLVRGALPDWKGSRLNMFNAFFTKTSGDVGDPLGTSHVNINLGVVHSGDNYDVTLTVRRFER